MKENKHQAFDLVQMQSLPLETKIKMSERRIREWYEHWNGEVYVAVSGGKDSQVLADIIKRIYPDVPCVYVRTGLEYESVDKKGVEMSNMIIRPEKSFVQIVTEYGYPIASKEVAQSVYEVQYARFHNKPEPQYRLDRFNGTRLTPDGKISSFNNTKWKFLLDAPFRISHKCCNEIKKKPSKKLERESGLKPYIGTLACESRLRKQKWIRVGCNAFEEDRPTSQPLSFWTEQDILRYIKINNLDIADVYGEVTDLGSKDGYVYENDFYNMTGFIPPEIELKTTGEERTGCVFCMFGITHDKDKFVRLREREKMKFDYIMRGGKFDEQGIWIPAPDENGKMGLGYKFVIDWLNEHGNLGIRY